MMDIKPDFGFAAPHETKRECANPQFKRKRLHKLAIVKDEHFGSKGDRDEAGVPGWLAKCVCAGCGREFSHKRFYVD